MESLILPLVGVLVCCAWIWWRYRSNRLSVIFAHDFFASGLADARNWVNPDGERGGIVAVRATVHPTATIGPGAQIAPSAVIGPHAVVGKGAIIEAASVGAGAQIGALAVVSTGCHVGDKAVVGYRAALGALVTVGEKAEVMEGAQVMERATLAAGAIVRVSACVGPHVSMGVNAVVGDFAVVMERAVLAEGAHVESFAVLAHGVHFTKGDIVLSAGPQDGLAAIMTAVYSPVHGLRWWMGDAQALSSEDFSVYLAGYTFLGENPEEDLARYVGVIQHIMAHPRLKQAVAAT